MKNKKKGFTLAELLIVVAIIAVLTAIAVPLFVTALNKAQDATKDANIRAVRGAAVVEILNVEAPAITGNETKDSTNDIFTFNETNKAWELVGPWYATATINANGDITKIIVNKTVVAESYKKSGEVITVVVKINQMELTTS